MAKAAAVIEQPELIEETTTVVYVLSQKLPERGLVYDERGNKRADPEYPKNRNVPKDSSVMWPGGTDPFTGKERPKGRYPIRYYFGCETLFVDGQPKDKEVIDQARAATPDILFVNGYLEIPKMDTMYVSYMDMCSWNGDSPYRNQRSAAIFIKLDVEKIAEEEANLVDKSEKALTLAGKASVKHMRTHAMFLNIPSVDHKSGQRFNDVAMRAKYKKFAFENPQKFLESYNDKSAQIKVWIEQLIGNGTINTNIIPNKAVWGKDGQIICDLSGLKSSESILNKLIEFSQTEEGGDFLIQLKGIYE